MVISGYEHVPVYENTSHRFVGGEEKDVSDQICITGCQIFWSLNISELDYKKPKEKKTHCDLLRSVVWWGGGGEGSSRPTMKKKIAKFQIFKCLDIEYK